MLSLLPSGRRATASSPVPGFSHDFTTATLPPNSVFTRSGAALYYNATGFLVSAATNTPRFGYDPISRENMGFVVEEPVSAKNIYARPSAGTTANHFSSVPAGLSVVTDAANPAKNLTAGTNVWKIDNSAGGSAVTISFAGTAGNTNKHSLQIWVKVGGGSGGTIDLTAIGSVAFNDSAWTLIESVNLTPPSSAAQMRLTVNAGATVFFTCANLQENIFNTTLIDTAGAAAGRLAEKLVVTLGAWFNATKGTFIVDHVPVGFARRAAQSLFYLGGGSNNDRLMITVNPDGGHGLRCTSNSVSQVNVNVGNTVMNERRMTEGLMYSATNYTAALNGAISGRYAMTALPLSFSSGLIVGNHPSSGSEYSGSFKSIAYYKQPLTENQLRRLSRPRTPWRFSFMRNPSLDMILIAGQSNAVGQGTMTGLPTYANAARMWMLGNDDAFKAYSDPYDSNINQKDSTSVDAAFGFAFPGVMMDGVISTTKRDCAVVPCAKGGSGITSWAPESAKDAALYISLLRRAYLAREYGRLRGLVWYQGEEDALNGTSGGSYTTQFNAFVERLRTDLDDPAFPILIIGLHNEPTPLGSRPAWAQIQNAQAAFTGKGIGYVSAAGCAVQAGDTVHLSTPGQITLGQRIAPVLAALISD